MKDWIYSLLLLLLPGFCWAQPPSTCFDVTEVRIPLASNEFALDGENRGREDLDINLVYYQPEDNYTFWYKLVVEEDCLLGFRVASTNEDDDYDFLLYRYNGENFCDTLKYKPLNPVSKNTYRIKREHDAALTSGTAASYQNAMQLKAGDTYYLSVLSLSEDDCGHKLFLATGEESVILSAVHAPCFQFNQPQVDDVTVTSEGTGTLIVEGLVRDQNTDEVIRADIEITDEATGEVLNLESDLTKGYRATLKANYTYKLKCSSFGYEPIFGVIEFYNSTVYNFYLPKLQKGNKVVMKDIYFHPNTYAFKDQSEPELDKLRNFLENNPKVEIEIEGHTAANIPVREVRPEYRGKSEEWTFTGSAKKLSKLRAEAVKSYLVKKGISDTRISIKGYGGDQNIIKNPRTREEKAKNMRVEVKITETGE